MAPFSGAQGHSLSHLMASSGGGGSGRGMSGAVRLASGQALFAVHETTGQRLVASECSTLTDTIIDDYVVPLTVLLVPWHSCWPAKHRAVRIPVLHVCGALLAPAIATHWSTFA